MSQFQPSVPQEFQNTSKGLLESILENASLRWLGALISLILFVAIISLSYTLGVKDVEKGAVPIIVSDGSPMKVRPQNPGGKQFPYQDMSVYQSLRGEELQNNSVILADNSERPLQENPALKMRQEMAKQQQLNVPNDLQEVSSRQDSTLETSSVSMPKPSIPAASEPVKTEMPPAVVKAPASMKPVIDVPIPAPVVAKVPEKTISVTPAKPAEATPKPLPVAAGGSAYLQVGAYRSEAEAQKAWAGLSAKHGGSLRTSSHVIVRADIPGKGVFYRLRVGPYGDKNTAVSVCSGLSAKGQGCMFVNQN